MICTGCGHENRPKAKFCEECATPLQRRCASCGSELRPSARFCDECAAPAAAAGAPRAAPSAGPDIRKVVTIVFADLVGSTALHERLDAESARRFMEGYYAAMRAAVEAHGGAVTQLLGDGVKAVFGIPRVAEDDALRAVRAAVAMQEAFRALAAQQRGAVGKTGLRVAVNTGEVVVSGAAEIIGDPVNVAARLQEQGRDGDVVVGGPTHRLVAAHVTLEPLGSLALKGRSEAVKAYRVVSLDAPASAATAAFVGREAEIARLGAVYATAVEKPAACLGVVLGSPGLGKSRLIGEFARRLGGSATLVAAHCDAAGGASFAPLAEALRELLGLDADAGPEAVRAAVEPALPGEPAERARIAAGIAALLTGSPASPEETFFVVRRLLAALAAAHPVLLVIDDLQWAEPLLLDLIEHLVQWGSGVPLLVLVGARPELRDLRSSLGSPGGLVADVVTLAGLDAGAAMRLAANVIGAADLPAAVAAKVLAASEGNPLFVGELVRMLVDEGALTREGERWTAGTALAALEMPPTIHALLAARIERMRPAERSVLERAAVVGRHFSRGAVAELMPGDASDLDARLEALRRSELIERDVGWFLGEPMLRFHHTLIRDAAYRRLLKGTRAELHTRFADWVEARADHSVEHDEMVGWHLEQTHQLLRELGPLDAAGQALGVRASKALAAAGQRALDRDDLPLAAGLLGRALACLEALDPARGELALDWCDALLAAGNVAAAAAAIEELGRFTAGSERLRAWHICFAGQHTVLTAPRALDATAAAVAAAAETLTALGDAAGEAKAHFVTALALSRLGKIGSCEAALDLALSAARRAGDRRRASTVLALAPLAALWGPSPVTRASGRCLDVVRVLRITQGAPAVEAVALSCQGVLEALRGRTDAARRMIASARKLVEELGISQRLFEADAFAGLVDLLEGDAPGAERWLRGAYEGLRDLGLGIDAARAAALLARALLAQDRVAEAEELSHASESLAGDDLKAAIAWRGVRAEALARRGETLAAVELASQAVEIAAATDAPLDHADARLALAAALRAAGRSAEADAEERQARELWEAKGAVLLAERAGRDGVPPTAAFRGTAAAAGPRPPSRRAATSNASLAHLKRFDAGIAARDLPAVAAQMHPEFEALHHPTGTAWDREGALALFRQLFSAENLTWEREVLATLGDRLSLSREAIRVSALDDDSLGPFGAAERERFALVEVGAEATRRRVEFFACERLGGAIARLYERHAELLPHGPEHSFARVFARAITAMLTPFDDIEGYAELLTPDIELADRRTLGTWSALGREGTLHHFHSLHEVAQDIAMRDDEVLGLDPRTLLLRRTHSGTETFSGGGGRYVRQFLLLTAGAPDGRLARIEWFDADAEALALARFDELANPVARPVPRNVRPNAVTRLLQRLEEAFDARDVEAYAALFSDSFEAIDHPTGGCWGTDAVGRSIQRLFGSQDPQLRHDVLATFGPSLALVRRTGSASGTRAGGFDTGPIERVDFSIHATDARGLFHRSEVFAADRLASAVARFYEFHAEAQPAGPQRERAAATARSVAELTDPAPQGNPGTAARPWFSPAVEFADHRTLSLPSGSGAEDMLRIEGSLHDLAHDFAGRTDAVLRLEPSAALLGMTLAGLRRDGGGAFEYVFLALAGFDGDGRCDRYESFDVGDGAEARARFEALFGGARRDPSLPQLPACFESTATRVSKALVDAFLTRDWPLFARRLAPGFRTVDRRRVAHLELDRDDYVAFTREIGDLASTRCDHRIVATRGDRLALVQLRFDLAGDAVGASEIGFFTVVEADATGVATLFVRFDSNDLDAAYAELDARYQADRSAADVDLTLGFSAAVAAGDWDTVAGLCSSGFVEHDHRPLAVLGTTRGAEAWVRNFRTLVALAPDTTARFDHIREGARGILWQLSWCGTREGGDYEIPLCGVLERSERGRFSRVDIYDPEQLVQAAERFDELAAAGPPGEPFENSATHATQQMVEFWRARDWPAFAGAIAADFRYLDRRGLAQLDLDRDQYVEFTRQLGDLDSTQIEREVLATRGDRLALIRIRMRLAGGEVGPSELEFLDLNELDERGLQRTFIRFDPEDREAATAELHARFEASERATHACTLGAIRVVAEAWANRDWEALIASCAPGFANRDHRQLGFGMTLHDATTWARSQQVLIELAPDSRTRMDHLRLSRHGYLRQLTQYGTRDGGAFEMPFLSVGAVDELGRTASFDIYDLDKFEDARAQFEGLVRVAGVPSPFANTATRATDRIAAAWNARDWPRFTGYFAPAYQNFDRRRTSQLTLDRDRFVASTRELGDMDSARQDWKLLATRGERLALAAQRLQVAGDQVGPSVLEFLTVFETDPRGEVIAGFQFDADALEAAYAELDARFDAVEGAAHPHARGSRRLGFAARAAAGSPAFARLFAPDFVYHDHRLLGWGTLVRDVGMFERAIQSLFELAPDARYREDHVRVSEFGYWSLMLATGTREGGAFENAFLRVCQVDEHGLVQRMDTYDLDDVDEARARFEALGTNAAPDPLRVPSNAATRAIERVLALAAGGAWDAAAALCEPITFEDRRPAPGTGAGSESFVAHLKTAFDADLRPQCQRLALGGENAAILHLEWTPRAGGADAARQTLQVVKVDGAGRIVACVVFDPGDRPAAQEELSDRFVARGADAPPPSLMAFRRAVNARDRAQLRALLPDDFVFHDHRLAGLGRVEGAAAYVASAAVYWDLSPDLRLDELFAIATTPDARIALGRTSGSNTEGGAFESLYVSIFHHPGGRVAGIELFEPEERDAALRRFEEIGRARDPG